MTPEYTDSQKNDFRIEKEQLLKALEGYHRRWNHDLITGSFDFALEVHKPHVRQSGEPYMVHPIAVAKILTELRTDHIAVAAALLHDVMEDGGIERSELEERFGTEVALLVDGVTKISERRFHSYEEKFAESIKKVLLSTLKDLRVILIKFADRLHNMRTIDALSPKSQRRIALETRDVYSPLAHRLGIGRLARELDDLCLCVLDREAYDKIYTLINESIDERNSILNKFITPLNRDLKKSGITADIEGRIKSISSIYYKINQQGKDFSEIHDLLAVRIIVSQKSECYRVLGLVHDFFTPVSEHFNDFIAIPKSNLYQSLHTKVRDSQGQIIEVQIRTEEMHAIAEIGIAAHWRYKQGQLIPDELDEHYQWIRSLFEAQQEWAETGEFLESLKVDLFQYEIFVFTPEGKLLQLPRGATPIDFAYAIHSDIGQHAIGAKVRGELVNLNHKLESGDVVEILTSPNQKPSAEWLKFVRTSRARNRIKRWFRETRWEQSVDLGETLIKQELSRLKLRFKEEDFQDISLTFGYNELPDFYHALGSGVISLGKVMSKLVPKLAPDKETLISRIVRKVSKADGKVKVRSLDTLVVSIADCCNPLPGDPIVGFQITGRGLTVHRTDCRQVANLIEDRGKAVPVGWDVESEQRFNVRIHVVADDRPNLLRDITLEVASLKVNINRIEMFMENNLAVGYFQVEVRNLPHLTRLLGKINHIRGVLKGERQDIESDAMFEREIPVMIK